MRMTPDIASLSDPSTGVLFRVNGQLMVIGGTSVAAPTIAGFLATILCIQFINPLLYQAPYSTCFHDIVRGSNGSYFANIVYDNCTGLGSINGQALSSYILNPSVIVSGITLSSSIVTLIQTQTIQLSATILPANATNQAILWSSSNPSVATVTNGLITALTLGSAIITVSSIDGSNISATSLVTVEPVPIVPISSVTLNQTSITLPLTNTLMLIATITPSNATNQVISWSSSNPTVATVTNGLITALTPGSAVITVSSTDGSNVSAISSVTVPVPIVPVSSVTLNQTLAILQPTNTLMLTATVAPSNATDKTVTWSSNSANAAVNSSGVVTAVSAGSAIITATTLSGRLTAKCTLTIIVPATSISLSPASFTLHTGSTKSLTMSILPSNATNKDVIWSSSNTSVATVNSLGAVTGVSVGSAIIQVQTVDGGFISTTTVTVIIGIQNITLNTSNLSLLKGETFQAIATIAPPNATNKTMVWSTAISRVATVSNSGLITAVGNGTGIVSVFTQDGNKTASIIIRVITPVSSVRLNQSALSLTRNVTHQLLAVISPSTASNRFVSWSSNNSAIASVTTSGLVRGIAIGTTVITAQTVDGSVRASCTITVRA